MPIPHILDRPWDQFDAYLFDIDGTLLHCTDAVHYFAFCDALTAIAGRPLNLDGVVAHGNTDIGILRDALTLAGVPENEWRPRIGEICEAMCDQIDRNRHQFCITVLPRVQEVLLHLRAKGAHLGVATGNLERAGKRKLEAAHILELFNFAGWSDALENRSEVFARAVFSARQLAGSGAAILAVGDTPADVRAARANHLPVIAVATGIFSFADLQAEHPDLCIHSFEELVTSA